MYTVPKSVLSLTTGANAHHRSTVSDTCTYALLSFEITYDGNLEHNPCILDVGSESGLSDDVGEDVQGSSQGVGSQREDFDDVDLYTNHDVVEKAFEVSLHNLIYFALS